MFSLFNLFGKSSEKEHEELLVLAEKIISNYVKGNEKACRKELDSLLEKIDEHIDDDDVPMSGSETKSPKRELIRSLVPYTSENVEIDQGFIDIMNRVIEALQRHSRES